MASLLQQAAMGPQQLQLIGPALSRALLHASSTTVAARRALGSSSAAVTAAAEAQPAHDPPPQPQQPQPPGHHHNQPQHQPQPPQPPPQLNFGDFAAVFKHRPTGDLLRTYAVLSACSVRPLVRHADAIVRTSRRVLGDAVTLGVLRATFFRQFCAGETEEEIWPTINTLRAHGIGAIIDYAAEDDEGGGGGGTPAAASSSEASSSSAAGPDAATGAGAAAEAAAAAAAAEAGDAGPAPIAAGRQYPYEGEAQCDRHVGVFLRAIAATAKLPPQCFAAIKVTALGAPRLLERMSSALLEIRALFDAADADRDGFVDAREFEALYKQLFPTAPPETVARAFAQLDLEGSGRVDVISWSHRIRLQDMPAMVERIRRHGGAQSRLSRQLVSVALTAEEVALADALLARVATLAESAAQQGVKLMVDAEHTYFQPAIDHSAHNAMRRYNKPGGAPVIFNTYQAYLKGSRERLREDIERARREGYVFAAKLVRGAYVELERRRAAARGYPSPIQDTLEATHANFNACLEDALDEVAARRGAELMVASHNLDSVERAVRGCAARGLTPGKDGVFMGQLLGMSDQVSFPLGAAWPGCVYKYVPYGEIELVVSYLIRRAVENSGISTGLGPQLRMIRAELWRRARARVGLGGG